MGDSCAPTQAATFNDSRAKTRLHDQRGAQENRKFCSEFRSLFGATFGDLHSGMGVNELPIGVDRFTQERRPLIDGSQGGPGRGIPRSAAKVSQPGFLN
jgi:hypothetical protein